MNNLHWTQTIDSVYARKLVKKNVCRIRVRAKISKDKTRLLLTLVAEDLSPQQNIQNCHLIIFIGYNRIEVMKDTIYEEDWKFKLEDCGVTQEQIDNEGFNVTVEVNPVISDDPMYILRFKDSDNKRIGLAERHFYKLPKVLKQLIKDNTDEETSYYDIYGVNIKDMKTYLNDAVYRPTYDRYKARRMLDIYARYPGQEEKRCKALYERVLQDDYLTKVGKFGGFMSTEDLEILKNRHATCEETNEVVKMRVEIGQDFKNYTEKREIFGLEWNFYIYTHIINDITYISVGIFIDAPEKCFKYPVTAQILSHIGVAEVCRTLTEYTPNLGCPTFAKLGNGHGSQDFEFRLNFATSEVDQNLTSSENNVTFIMSEDVEILTNKDLMAQNLPFFKNLFENEAESNLFDISSVLGYESMKIMLDVMNQQNYVFDDRTMTKTLTDAEQSDNRFITTICDKILLKTYNAGDLKENDAGFYANSYDCYRLRECLQWRIITEVVYVDKDSDDDY